MILATSTRQLAQADCLRRRRRINVRPAMELFCVLGLRRVGFQTILHSFHTKTNILGVRIVQNYGNLCPALVLDGENNGKICFFIIILTLTSAKVSAFYEPQELVATVFSITDNNMPTMHDWRRIRGILADVRVQVMFARYRSFGIGRFTDKPMTELM